MRTRIWRRTTGVGIAGLLLALALPVHSAVPLEAGTDGPAASLVSPGPAASSPVGHLLGRRFTLSKAERAVRVTRAVTTDFDADGDIDAIAATSAGTIVVWLNVGQNRLERLPPRSFSAGQTHLGRPLARGAHTLQLDTVDSRWLHFPARRQTDISAPRVPNNHTRSRAVPIGEQLDIPPRAPPGRRRSTL